MQNYNIILNCANELRIFLYFCNINFDKKDIVMINRVKRILGVMMLSLLCVDIVLAIEPTWEVNMGSVFDNREGDTKMNNAKTFFFVTLAPEIGLKFSDKDRISGGAVWTQPLENTVKNGKIIPLLYYRHESDTWKFSMGMFPRTQLHQRLPGFLWNDSLEYFQKSIRGALVQYNHDKGFFDAYIDWRGIQSEITREAFNIVFHGECKPKGDVFIIGGHLMMNHLARRKNSPDDERVVDNFLVNTYLGMELDKYVPLDKFNLKAGAVMTIERNRADEIGWRTPGGFWMDLLAEWKFLGLRNSLYIGGKLFPEYGELGSVLYQGEPFYMSSFYNRTDIYAKIFSNKNLNLEAQLNFNFAKNNFIFYQRLILEVQVGNITSYSKR